MGHEIVQAVYRAKPGKADALAALVAKHEPALRAAGLVTDRPFVVMRSPEDGTLIEIFEWASREAAGTAHGHEVIGPLWESMAKVADFLTLADVPEATRPFAHFQPF